MTSATSRIAVQDQLAIGELLGRYGLLIDSHRVEEWLDLFEVGAVVDIAGRDLIDTEAGLRNLATISPRGVHLGGPPIIGAEGPSGTAKVEQSFSFHNFGTGRTLGGWYDDTLAKTDGCWRFRARRIRFFAVP